MEQEFELKERILRYYLFNKQKVIGYLAVGFAFAALCIVYLTHGPSVKESIAARIAFEQWRKSPSGESLKNMEQKVKKSPGLYQAFQAEIAQILLSLGQIDEASNAAASCIARLKEVSPFHASFAESSLLIEKKEYQKALEASVSLKEGMASSEEGSALHAWNLLRIAFLQKQLGNHSGELSAWEDVRALLSEEKSQGKVLDLHFSGKNYSLSDFISQRERSIEL